MTQRGRRKKRRVSPIVRLRLGALVTAAVFLFAPASRAGSLPLKCSAPQWLAATVRGSMEAVWRELQTTSQSLTESSETLALVGSRLYAGFEVTLAENRKTILLRPREKWNWSVRILPPEGTDLLPDECRKWLDADLASLTPRVNAMLKGVPPEALQWSSESFQNHLTTLSAEKMPGWRPHAKVSVSGRDAVMELKFYPQTPVLLAVLPETLSNSMPQLLADRTGMKTMETMAPFIGLPLPWLSRHKKDIESWLSLKQENKKIFQTLQVAAKNEIQLKPISKVNTRIESRTYSLRGWFSAHIGSEARLEAGLHFGHYFYPRPDLPFEAYGELIMALEHWRLDVRGGLRTAPIKDLPFWWIGVEASSEKSSHLWYRLWYETGRPESLYGWVRFSDNDDFEAALGYHVNRYIAMELYYDDRQDHKLSLRARANL